MDAAHIRRIVCGEYGRLFTARCLGNATSSTKGLTEIPVREYGAQNPASFGNYSRSGTFLLSALELVLIFPLGNMTTNDLGKIIQKRRKSLHMKQTDLALVSGTGVRFISDMENGKETCVIGKTLKVMQTLGMEPVIRSRDEK
jgi:hypothetical protein